MALFKIQHTQPGIVSLSKHYSISGKNISYRINDTDLTVNIETLSSIRVLSNLDKIKSVNEYYPELFKSLNFSGSLNFIELLGKKKSQQYLTYLKEQIENTSKFITNYHTSLFKNRVQCYRNLEDVELNGEVLERPLYNHSGVTGRTSITSGFNFLTLKKDKRKHIKPVNKDMCLVEVDFKSCEPFFYLKSKNFNIDSDDVYMWLCNKYDIKINNRDYVKRGILSMIYGANENTISKIMKISKSKVLEIKSDLGLDCLRETLQNYYDKNGFFLNYYGRPITSDNNLVNYYIQSSAVDFCSLAFYQFCIQNNVRPSYFIHDSMTFQCSKKDLKRILSIASIKEANSNIDIPIEFNVLHA